MGLLSFAKSVGAKIFGGTQTAAAPPGQLKDEAEKLELDVPNADIEADGHKVILPVEAASADEAGKIAGNSAGTATVENEVSAAVAATEPKFCTVQPGDTLWTIAEAEYGTGHGSKYNLIFEANTPMLTDPDKIYPGQVLRIPPLPTETEAS
ncbi:MAG: peptidoglycan-binding protein LysM [Beijerinckiaceae bacterium]|nr:peptidoglycan-binding protein LysM [Beijerinckiaceae bacterium]MCI0734818.1 peptidoglycan-binding protein LysM [Beijerinckiaceae bacterium]